MKFRGLVVVFLFVISGLFAQKQIYLFTSFNEPATDGLRFLYSYNGYKWTDVGRIFLKPEVGRQKVMRDPSLAQGPDGTFHLVWTSSWRGDQGFGYAYSNDLIHWSEQRFLPVMEYDTSTVNVWAPEIFYDKPTRRFIIIWASTIPYKFPKGAEEEKNNHRLYYTTTKDFKKFSKTKLVFDPGYSSIDATILQRGKKDYVMVFKDNTRPMRNIKVAFSTKATGLYSNESDSFTPLFCEGPSVAKVGNDWLIYYDSYKAGIYGCAKTTDFKTFTDVTNEVEVPKGHKHGTIIMVNEITLNNLLK